MAVGERLVHGHFVGVLKIRADGDTHRNARDAQAERAARIVRNLLTFARPSSLVKEPVDLNDVVARTALLISYEMRQRGIELERALDPEPVVVMGDRYELQQVLLNLLINARQAMLGRGGSITIKAQAVDAEEVRLQVIDTGPGIPARLIPNIFQPFFTTKGTTRKGEQKGTGLGLSICYGIIKEHGGDISARNRPDGGAIIAVRLPAAVAAQVSENVSVTPQRDLAIAGRILLVEGEDAEELGQRDPRRRADDAEAVAVLGVHVLAVERELRVGRLLGRL